MTIATLDEVVAFDDDGCVDGLQFDSRERAIQQWRERKEQEEFLALVDSLHKRNYARRARLDPEKRKRIQEADRKHRESGRKQQRANELRREKHAANPPTVECQECGKVETLEFGERHRKFCSKQCRNRWHGRRRQRGSGLLDTDLKDRVIATLRSEGPMGSKRLAELTKGKITSLRTCLVKWVRAGEIQSDGKRPATFSLVE